MMENSTEQALAPDTSTAQTYLPSTEAMAARFGVSPATFTNWRWQMRRQITSLEEARLYLNLASEEEEGFQSLREIFHAGVTPYYLALMAPALESGDDRCPIRLQALPRQEELKDRLGQLDPLEEVAHSPVKELVHVYPDRVAFCVAQLCPVYCRYCYRKRRDGEVGLHFNRKIIERGIAYISENTSIRDVLITGGDPFITLDESLEHLLKRLRAIPHVEIVRFGTRTPVTLPYRITEELVAMLKRYHPIWLNTHFNCPEELTEEARIAVTRLVDAGVPVGNQAVLLKGVNDSTERMAELCKGLLKLRARPYYVFHPHAVEGTEHLRVSVRRGMAIMKGLRGNLTGFGIPTYALDTPSGKIPLQHPYVLGEDGEDLLVEGLRGEIWREKGALRE